MRLHKDDILGKPHGAAAFVIAIFVAWAACGVGMIWSAIRLGQRVFDEAKWTMWQIATPWLIGIAIAAATFLLGFVYSVTKGDG